MTYNLNKLYHQLFNFNFTLQLFSPAILHAQIQRVNRLDIRIKA